MSSHLSKEQALAHINYYREGAKPDDLRCVLLNSEVIQFIADNAATLNGMRVYLAKYKRGVYPVTEDPSLENKQTIIVVPTSESGGDSEDNPNGYFNYGALCPQICKGDAGQ